VLHSSWNKINSDLGGVGETRMKIDFGLGLNARPGDIKKIRLVQNSNAACQTRGPLRCCLLLFFISVK
jgi:hypothetical protein